MSGLGSPEGDKRAWAASHEHDQAQAAKCRYMDAAYPTLDFDDACGYGHRHEARVFDLARAMAAAIHEDPDPSDDKVGWFLNDADAVVDDFDETPGAWVVTAPSEVDEDIDDLPGIDFTLTINGRPYVVQSSDFEPAHPVARATWESWHEGDEVAP